MKDQIKAKFDEIIDAKCQELCKKFMQEPHGCFPIMCQNAKALNPVAELCIVRLIDATEKRLGVSLDRRDYTQDDQRITAVSIHATDLA